MRRHLNLCLAGWLGLALLMPGCVSAKDLADQQWIEVTTPNFVIRSTMSESKTDDLARHAEMLRAAILLLTNTESVDTAVPTVVYALPGRDYSRLVDSNDTAGIFLADPRQNFILIRDSSRVDESATMKHEYVHELTRGLSGADFPKWYIEGIAEYFETSQIKRGKFRVGVPGRYHAQRLFDSPWITPEEFLTSSKFAELGQQDFLTFYSQSWALVHYLMHSESNAVSFNDGFKAYEIARKAGTSEIDSFATAFKIDPDELRQTLKQYVRTECCAVLSIETDQLLPTFEPIHSEMTRTGIALGLGQLALLIGATDAALEWFDIAATSPSTRAQSLAFSATILANRGELQLADARIGEAIALAPDDPGVHTEYAAMLVSRATMSEDPDTKSSLLQQAQSSLVRAWRLDNRIPLVYSLTGQTYLMLGSNSDRAVEMLEQAVVMAPSHLRFRYQLAWAYLLAERHDDALAMAVPLLNWSHGVPGYAERVQQLIERIENSSAEKSRSN